MSDFKDKIETGQKFEEKVAVKLTKKGKPWGKPGRPPGKTDKTLSIDKRLKILTKLALDNSLKPTDRIAAISQMTALLNDKIKNTEDGYGKSVLSFEVIEIEKPKQVVIDTKPIEETTTTTTTQSNAASETFEMNFVV